MNSYHERTESDRDGDELFRKIATLLPEAVILHSGGEIVAVNDEARQLLAAETSEDVVGKKFLNFIHPDDRKIVRERIRTLKEKGQFTPLRDYRVLQCSGAVVYVEATATTTYYAGRSANLVVLRNVTDKRLAKKKLIRINEKLLKEHKHRVQLSKSLIDLCERDRRGIAMELHDNIGQTLTTLHMDLEFIAGSLDRQDGPAQQRIAIAMGKTSRVIGELREIATGLLPSMIDNLGLTQSTRYLVKSIEASGTLKINLFLKDTEERFDREKELTVYRIIQEGLANVVKHAQAEHVHINVIRKSQSVVVSIEDDGIGFDADTAMASFKASGPLGLHIMLERAEQFDGKFTIESSAGKGTLLLAEIPL